MQLAQFAAAAAELSLCTKRQHERKRVRQSWQRVASKSPKVNHKFVFKGCCLEESQLLASTQFDQNAILTFVLGVFGLIRLCSCGGPIFQGFGQSFLSSLQRGWLQPLRTQIQRRWNPVSPVDWS